MGEASEAFRTHQNEQSDDFLELDAPERRHRTFGLLGLLFLGVGAGLLAISVLLTSTLSKGSLDLLVLILWLGTASLAFGGLGLLGAAGITTLVRKAR